MYGSSPLRSTLNTNVITGSGMCKVCTGTRCKGVVTGSPTMKYYPGLSGYIYIHIAQNLISHEKDRCPISPIIVENSYE